MLTEAEKEWLERRKNLCLRCDLNECPRFVRGGESHMCRWFSPHRIEFENYRDAAEFEARVAEKLARDICFRCHDKYNEICPKGIGYFRLKLGIVSCGMKHARLAVEEEMESSK